MGKTRKVYLANYEYWLGNGDRVLVEVIDVGDPKYEGGIMYTFRCVASDGETLFAVENSHGTPHIHMKGEKFETTYNWKQALKKFSELKLDHERKNGLKI